MMNETSQTAIYTFEEVREILKTSRSHLRTLLSSGELKGFKLGKYNWRIPEESLKEYIKKKMDC